MEKSLNLQLTYAICLQSGLQVDTLLKRSMTDACGQHADINRQHILTEVNSALAKPLCVMYTYLIQKFNNQQRAHV